MPLRARREMPGAGGKVCGYLTDVCGDYDYFERCLPHPSAAIPDQKRVFFLLCFPTPNAATKHPIIILSRQNVRLTMQVHCHF